MKKLTTRLVFARAAVLAAFFTLCGALRLAAVVPLAVTPDIEKQTVFAVFCMEHGHYLNKTLDKIDQRKLLGTYMSDLDGRHLFFLQGEVDGFQTQFASSLVHNVRDLGNIEPAFTIFDKFRADVRDRVAWINKRLDGNFDLTAKDLYRPDREKSPWPSTKEEADKLWEQQLRFELINELLTQETREIDAANKKVKDTAAPAADAANPIDTKAAAVKPADAKTADAKLAAPKTAAEKLADAKAEIRKRYNRSQKILDDTDSVEVQEVFLNTLANQYDPHTTFWSPYELEEFDITMRNSLVGIGAVLYDKDGVCQIRDLVPNGPADKSGQIHPGDSIVAVGQAEGELVDVVGLKLRKTVNLIRGAEGSDVRLAVIPATAPDDKKIVTIKREEIKLTTSLAKAQIIDVPIGSQTVPVGVIDLPTFYGKGGDGNNFSTTEDVRELIGKLKAAGVQGIVLDLRRNGGGFLDEAIDLTGLFIPPSPVLQVNNTLKVLQQLKSDNTNVAWDGPLMLLVSKLSASATEILTGALQDYRRALVVGDSSTHGKGTVQTVFHFNDIEPKQKGAAKVTIQKWYLPDGNSIQSKGVTPDIVLPSDIDFLPIGEADLKNALAWDSVTPLPLTLQGDGPWRASLLTDSTVSALRKLSNSRQQDLDEFVLMKERVEWEKTRQEQKDFSLNFNDRMAQRRDDIAFRDKLNTRIEAMAKSNFKSTELLVDAAKAQQKDKEKSTTADNSSKPIIPAAGKVGDEDDAEPKVNFDIQLREGLRIMADWIALSGQKSNGPATITASTGSTQDAAMASATGTAAPGTASSVPAKAPVSAGAATQ